MYAIYGADTTYSDINVNININLNSSGGDGGGKAGGECIASSKPYGVMQ